MIMRPTQQPVVVGFFTCAFLIAAACAGREPGFSSDVPIATVASFRPGQIIETANEQAISVDELTSRLLQQDVIYFGEEHHNRFHIDAALSVLQRLLQAGRRPVLALEMFGWESQPVLDHYIRGDTLSRQDFLTQVGWSQNWGGSFETYEPLVSFPKKESLRLVALNPPKGLVRLVAKKGLEQARRDPEWIRWSLQGETIVDDPAYRQRIFEQLRACHGGGSDDMYQTMYEASMVRDEGMAKTIVSVVESLRDFTDSAAGPVVSYTGGGHVQYNVPVPQRVVRRLSGAVRQTTIYMTSYEQGRGEDLQEMLTSRIADYIWLTPTGGEGMPRRCR
jgi:uncharacterized iron-regulated protein